MSNTIKTGINWTKLFVALVMMCLMFGLTAMAQTGQEKPLDAEAAAALIDEFAEGLYDLIDDEDQVTAIIEKWDAREDLAGKTRMQILNLLFADVKSVIGDKETLDSIWQGWRSGEKSDEERPVVTPKKPATPPVKTPAKPVADETPLEKLARSERFTHTTDISFDPDRTTADLVPVFFWNKSCGPCNSIAPILDNVAREYDGKVKMLMMNVDENTEIPAKFNIRVIPTLMVFKIAYPVATKTGTLSKEQLNALLNENLR